MSRRPGLSRGEVVVLLCILLVSGALLLTAVVRVRESAARMSCSNNLKQLAIAVHNYNDASNKLPPLVDQGAGAPTGHGLPSAYRTLDPFIEAGVHVYRIGESPPANYHAHSSVPFTFHDKEGRAGTMYGGDANQIRWAFLDPSDTTADHLRDVPMTLPDGTTGYYAAGSYAANGLLPWSTGRLQQLTNGTAETILIAERPQVCRTAAGEPIYNLWGLGFYSPHMPAFAALAPIDPPGLGTTGQVAPVVPLPDEGAVDRGARIRVRVGRWDAEPMVPDFATPVQLIGRDRPCNPRLPGTPHHAGMQVAMADGSVRLFAPDTDPWVFWASCAVDRGRATDRK
jgi:hypothetical protein